MGGVALKGATIGRAGGACRAARRPSRLHLHLLDDSPPAARRAVVAAYTRGARWYDLGATATALGAHACLRRAAVALLRLKRGDTVLDLACGTGANFPLLQAAIGPTGRIIGVDVTGAMLAQARARVRRAGWTNVVLVQGDAAAFALRESVDAVLSTLAIGLILTPRRVLEGALAALRPGGRIVVADGRLVRRWYGFLVNPLLRLSALLWAPPEVREAYWAARPWDDLRDLLGAVEYREAFGGAVYLTAGTKPRIRQRRAPARPLRRAA